MKYQTHNSYVFDECKNFQEYLRTSTKITDRQMDMKIPMYFQILFVLLGKGYYKSTRLAWFTDDICFYWITSHGKGQGQSHFGTPKTIRSSLNQQVRCYWDKIPENQWEIWSPYFDISTGTSRQTMVLSSAAMQIWKSASFLLMFCVVNTCTVLKLWSIAHPLSAIFRCKFLT